MIVDTHAHVACADRERFPLAPNGATADWWERGGTVDELLSEHDANGVERVVIVQAIGAYGYDCRCAAESAADHRDRAALVVAVDMSSPDPAADLRRSLDDAAMRPVGVRLFGVGGASTDWLTDGRGASVMEVAASEGLVAVPTVLADRFTDLASLASTTPDVPLAVDHCGFPDLCELDVDRSWRQLAEVPSAHLKVTSFVLEGAVHSHGDPAPTTERLAEVFGTERLCWGSDHPQDARSDYAGKLDLARRATRTFDDAGRSAFFADTALRLFF